MRRRPGNDGKWKLMVMVAAMDPVPCRVRVEGGVYAVAKVAGAADCDS